MSTELQNPSTYCSKSHLLRISVGYPHGDGCSIFDMVLTRVSVQLSGRRMYLYFLVRDLFGRESVLSGTKRQYKRLILLADGGL